VDPAQETMNDRPQDRVIGRVRNGDRQRCAEAGTIFRPIYADDVPAPAVHITVYFKIIAEVTGILQHILI